MYRHRDNFFAKKGIYVFLFLLANYLLAQELPKVIGDNIYFSGRNNYIKINNNDVYHLFPIQERLVLINRDMKPNFFECQIRFYNFKGEKIAQSDILRGEFVFVFIDELGKMLAGQRSMLTMQNTSYLYDLEGNLINAINHDYFTKQIGVTLDKKYFWFVSNKMVDFNHNYIPYNYIMIFDSNTWKFVIDYLFDGTEFKFMLGGEEYSLLLTKPDLPG